MGDDLCRKNKLQISTNLLANGQFHHPRVEKLLYQPETKLEVDRLNLFNQRTRFLLDKMSRMVGKYRVLTNKFEGMREGNVFTGVCLLKGGGGVTPLPGSFLGPFWVQTPVLARGTRASVGLGYPIPLSQDSGTLSPCWNWGTPPPPSTEQQSESLLRGGWYVACSHAGGPSC